MAAYAITIFTGAFLLFLVQPLIGKFILPWFGGSPGVWATCMLFFQLLLLGGYAYAHWLTTRFSPRRQVVIHLALLALAALTLPILPSDAWKPAPGSMPVPRILLLLVMSVGMPYFMLSTTGPLLQRWLSFTHPGVVPYRLYALSNIGSLLALVVFPFVLEPNTTRRDQAMTWSAGMILFTLACGYCGWRLWKSGVNLSIPAPASQNPSDEVQPNPVAAPAEQRWLWFMLPACASTLLLAATNKICQDVAVIPFLWVLPLALYLLSFIIAFDSPRWYSRFWFGLLYFVSLVGVCYGLYRGVNVPVWAQLLFYGGALFFAAMVCHGEVYRLRPQPARLTAYFLWVSAGGACGGLLVALLAPAILPDNYEFQAALLFPGITLLILFWRENRPVMDRRTFNRHAAILFSGVLVAAMALVSEVAWSRRHSILSTRNFYGSMTVYEYNKDKPDGHYHLLQHGKITHGLQFRRVTFAEWPTTYYGEESGIGLAISQHRKGQNKRVGLVGLGTGTLASYGRKGDYFRIYEINPAVEKIAREKFSYIEDSAAKVDVILGDARLSMEHEPPQQFDILALDAFSSDAIPVHLLTREAFALYQRHLKPDGVIVVHVSNRYLDLRPVVTDLAKDAGMHSAIIEHEDDEDRWWIYSSTWILVTRNQDLLDDAKIATATDFEELTRKVPLWTDDYSALFQILK